MGSMGWLVLEGKGGDRSRGKHVEIPVAGTLLCGRSSQADLILSATAVSRRHTIFFHEGEKDWVRDAGSTNGTLLNGIRLEEPAPLRDGDKVQVGVVELVYREFVARPSEHRPPRRSAAPAGLLSDTPRWRDVTLIGRGGMGEVYRARDRDLATMVAIKRLRRRQGGDAKILERLHAREAALGRTIVHPNVVGVLEECVFHDDPLLLLEWVDGKDLSVRAEKLHFFEKLEVLRQAALGLDAAHRAGIVHADLKPANLLLCSVAGSEAKRDENLSILESPDVDEEPLGPDDALEREIAERIGLPERPDLDPLPFVGRDAELAYIAEIREEVSEGGMRWVLLFGERGVGRHRLIEEARLRAGKDDLEVAIESPKDWGPPPEDFVGVWITPLPPFLPDDPDFERAASRARAAGQIRELYLKPFLSGQAIRLVEAICHDRESARAFIGAVGREVTTHPALLRQAIADGFDRGAWRPSGGGYRLDVSALKLDERAVAEQLGERFRGEEKGVRDLLTRLSIVAGALDFEAIAEISGFDSATLYYLLGHVEAAGYLVRTDPKRLRFSNVRFRRSLDPALVAPERRKIVRKALSVLSARLSEPGTSTELLLGAAELARAEGRMVDAYRWSVSAALLARQSYERVNFFAAVDGARECYRESKEGSERRALQNAGEELLGPGGRGLDGLDRLRSLPIEVNVKIADFGIARRIDPDGADQEGPEMPWGTPRYMSPEQARGAALGSPSDVFSLGIVTRELLEGAHPLGALRGKGAVRAILEGAASPRSVVRGKEGHDREEPLNALIGRMVSLNAADRPTAIEVADELQRLQIRAALSP